MCVCVCVCVCEHGAAAAAATWVSFCYRACLQMLRLSRESLKVIEGGASHNQLTSISSGFGNNNILP